MRCGRGAPSPGPALPSLLDSTFGAPGRTARRLAALWRTLALAEITHARPDWGIASVVVDGVEHPVVEEATAQTPFATLRRFRKVGAAEQPRVLLVAPMSGHFATLLRDTVRTMLRDHDVYVTDWHNVRDVPLSAGRFGLDEYIEHLIDFTAALGPGAQRRRDLPALRRRARRGRADGRGRSPGAAARA